MTAFKTVMPLGIPGTITRWASPPQVETVELDGTTPPTVYGLPYKMVSGKALTLADADTASLISGILARPFPGSPAPTPNEGLGTDTPNKDYPQSGLRSGHISVVCYGTTEPATGGKAYVRVNGADGTHPIGGIEAASVVAVTSLLITGTGTGTLAMTADETSVAGTYSLTLQTTSGTSKVTVIDPNGNRLADATVGSAYTAQGIAFTITAGGTMTAGDSFSPIVTHKTEAIPNCYFVNGRDSSKNAEVAFNL